MQGARSLTLCAPLPVHVSSPTFCDFFLQQTLGHSLPRRGGAAGAPTSAVNRFRSFGECGLCKGFVGLVQSQKFGNAKTGGGGLRRILLLGVGIAVPRFLSPRIIKFGFRING